MEPLRLEVWGRKQKEERGTPHARSRAALSVSEVSSLARLLQDAPAQATLGKRIHQALDRRKTPFLPQALGRREPGAPASRKTSPFLPEHSGNAASLALSRRTLLPGVPGSVRQPRGAGFNPTPPCPESSQACFLLPPCPVGPGRNRPGTDEPRVEPRLQEPRTAAAAPSLAGDV